MDMTHQTNVYSSAEVCRTWWLNSPLILVYAKRAHGNTVLDRVSTATRVI